MESFRQKFTIDLVIAVIITIISSIGITAWSLIDGLKPYFVGIMALGLLALSLLILVLYIYIRNWVVKGWSLRQSALSQTLRDWLYSYNYNIQNVPADDAHFQMLLNFTEPLSRILVVQTRKNPKLLSIGAEVEFTKEENELLSKLTDIEVSNAFLDLRLELHRLGIFYDFGVGTTSRIVLSRNLPISAELTEFTFLDEITLMRRGAAVTIEYITRVTNSVTPATP